MAAATQDVSTKRKMGDFEEYPMGAAKEIFAGTMVVIDTTTGYAEAGSDAANKQFVGVSDEWKDNTDGSEQGSDGTAGCLNIKCWRRYHFAFAIASAAATDLGSQVYLVDDQTVGFSDEVTHNIFAGVISKIESSTLVWVDIWPAIAKTDVTAHTSDADDAHDASAISIADAGSFTSETDVEAALQEIYQHLTTAQGFIPVPLTTIFEGDGTNTVAALGPATTPVLDMANGDTDSSLAITWAATEVDPVLIQVPLPPDINTGADLVLHLRAKMSGTDDTCTLAADTYFNEGDTKVEDTVDVSGATVDEFLITVAAADIPAGAQTVTMELTPGAHANDALAISAAWFEYTKSILAS